MYTSPLGGGSSLQVEPQGPARLGYLLSSRESNDTGDRREQEGHGWWWWWGALFDKMTGETSEKNVCKETLG